MPIVLQVVDIHGILGNARNLIASHEDIAVHGIEMMLIIVDQSRDERLRIRFNR